MKIQFECGCAGSFSSEFWELEDWITNYTLHYATLPASPPEVKESPLPCPSCDTLGRRSDAKARAHYRKYSIRENPDLPKRDLTWKGEESRAAVSLLNKGDTLHYTLIDRVGNPMATAELILVNDITLGACILSAEMYIEGSDRYALQKSVDLLDVDKDLDHFAALINDSLRLLKDEYKKVTS